MPSTPSLSPELAKAYERLKKVRESKTVALKPCPLLRDTIMTMDGKEVPFRLRYYQVQGVFHMLTLKRMILGDGTGLGKCVTEDTLLITDRGLIPIWELAPEEFEDDTFYDPKFPVRVWTGSCMAPVKRFYWNGEAETRRVTTRNGFQIEGSLAHPVLVRGCDGQERFKTLPELEEGDFICIDRSGMAPFPQEDPAVNWEPPSGPNTRSYTYPERLTPDLGRLLGYVVGESWSGHHYHTRVSQHSDVNPEAHADIRRLFKTVFGWEGSGRPTNRDKLINVSSVGIRKFLAACGVGYETSHHKVVPWVIREATKKSMKEFLRGLFEGEGSVVGGGVEFSTSSEEMARTVQTLLLRFNIVACLSPKRVKGFSHTYWRLTFFSEDARQFLREVGFVSSRKQEALREGLAKPSNPNKDTVPFTGLAVASLRDALREATAKTGSNDLRKGSGLKQFGESFVSTLKHVIHGHRNPTYRFLRQLLEVAATHGLEHHPSFHDLQTIVQQGRFYDPVANVESGRQAVMDIEVDHPSHAFSANGVINHNTIQTIATLSYLWATREPGNKVMVLAPKSAIGQWASELERFTAEGAIVPIIVGTEKPDSTATCTCECGGTWHTKARSKAKIICPQCKKNAKEVEIEVERESPVDAREREYRRWLNAPKDGPKHVLILNYALLVRDWNHGGFQPLKPNGKPDPKKPVIPGLLDRITQQAAKDLVVVLDEASAFKNDRTKTWETVRFICERAHRAYGLTATLLKNHLFEGYCIYKALRPGLFTTKTKFYEDYCFIKMQSVKGKRQIPIIVGYKNLDHFREVIDPFFLGRPKHAVSDELPVLTTREVVFDLGKAEDAKYTEALSGLLELGDGEVKDFEETKALTSLIYCQQVVNSLAMLKFKEGDEVQSGLAFDRKGHKVGSLSSKEQCLLDLITGELDGEKVIVYTRFASLVPRLQQILKRDGIKSVRITGMENTSAKRKKAQDAFQDLDSGVDVVFITDAGSEAINLQAAAATIFFDLPWSWGAYVQTLGRMIRIGSIHTGVFAFHLVARRPNRSKADAKTIDDHVQAMLRKKKNLIDKVLGEAAEGALKFDRSGSTMVDLLRRMQGKAD